MSSATKERAQTTLASWWSVQQVCMWIATRNERLVQYVGAKDSMLQVSETMSLAPHVNDSGEAATIPEILKSLKVACEFGQISFFGKENAEGTHVQVPADLWPMLEMRESDERGRRPIAAPTKDNGNGGKWWDDLFARASRRSHPPMASPQEAPIIRIYCW
jgi:hypothetical protein